jgi:glycosyltransferase involved in cell wall biosynthesis
MRAEQLVFSVIIPTYSRPERLAACLQSLTHLQYLRDRFEVIVVDDGSEPPVDSVVVFFSDRLDLVLLRQPNSGPAAARNTGAAQAKGKFLAFTDDDCTPAPDWLHALEARLAMTPEHMIGGRAVNALPHNLYSATSQIMTDAVYAYYNDDPDKASFFATNNVALPADRFHAIGGFDQTFPLAASEDRDFCERWLRHGYRMTYAPEAVVYHAHALTFRSFWRHYFNYGRGACHFHQVRTRRNWESIRVDPQFYVHLFRYPLLHMHGWRALLLAALLVISYTPYTAGFLWQRFARNGRR